VNRHLRTVLFCVASALTFAGTAAAVERPNIVFILVDDLRWDDLGCTGHPFVKTPHIDRIAREGVLFRNAFATTPLCSPSRHTHGIVDNIDRSAASHKLVTFPRLLHNAGYETGYIGKWHMGNDDSPRPGFDHWVALKGQGTSNDPELNENGVSRKVTGYTTDVLNDRTVDFVERKREKPFLLYVAHKALHPETVQRADGSLSDPSASHFIPAERHKQLYADAKIVRRPNAVAPRGKPALERRVGHLPPLGPATGTSDETIRDRLRMLAAVDEGVGRLFDSLEKTKQLDRTMIVLAGDHGYFYGEHGLSVERRFAYEESIRIPLLARFPPLVKPGSTLDDIVLNIDLAPTLLELGKSPIPLAMQGRSWLRLLKGDRTEWRDSFLIEYFSDKVFPRMASLGYKAVRAGHWKYIHYTEQQGMDELYDLAADPYELHNLIGDPKARTRLDELKAELARLRRATGD
jgi:N-acetylglucosamine-6-sulfatase